MASIAPVIRVALSNNKRAIHLYENNDLFAKSVLQAIFGLGTIPAAEKLAVQHGIKRFKLNWNYESFFAAKCAVWSAKKVKYPDILKSVFRSNGLCVSDTSIIDDIKSVGLFTAINRVRLLHKPDIHVAGELCNEIITKIKPSFFKYAKRKLFFIVKFYPDKSFDDIVGMMVEKAIYAFYRAYPLKSYEHILNSMRVAGYKYALTIIEYQQRQKRRVIDGGEDLGASGYSFTLLDLDAKNYGSAGYDFNDVENHERFNPNKFNVNIKDDYKDFEYSSFLKSCSKKQRKVIHLLSLEPDDGFMKFVKTKNPDLGRIHKPDTVYNMIGGDKYKKMVRRFVNMKSARFKQFIENLKLAVLT